MSKSILRVLALLVTALVAPLARAQSIVGAFEPMDDAYFFRDPNLILPDNIGVVPVSAGTALLIDRNGDGRLNQSNGAFPLDPVMPLPAEARFAFNYFLSPTRSFLLVRGLTTPGSCATGLRIQVYRVPSSGTTLTLVHDACLAGGLNNGNGEWYDTGLCHKSLLTGLCESPPSAPLGTNSAALFAALTTDASANPRILWLDLNNATPNATDGQVVTTFAGAANGMGQITIALGGNFAFVQSDIRNGNADFSVVDVCPSSPNFGDVVLGGPGYNDVGSFLTAAVTQIAGADVTIETFSNGSPFGSGVVRPDCPSVPPPPPTGACCVSGVCSAPVTSAACAAMGGTWTIGLSCTPNPCPQPTALLAVTMTGPASAVRGGPITYTLTYRNNGPIAASGVIVRNVLPAATTFISASSGGAFAAGAVTWTIVSVPPMSPPVDLTLTIQTPCSGASITNSNYTITGTGLPLVSGSPAVTTTLTAPPTAPVTMAVNSVPARDPLQGGDLVTHTITLTNTIAEVRQNLNIQLVRPGRSSRWQQVLDHAGGVATIQSGGSGLVWNGSLAPSATVMIVATTRVNDCISQSDSLTQLQDGQDIRLNDACFNQLGTARAPGPFALLKPIAATLAATNLTPGQVGPSARGGVFGSSSFQAIRDGAMLELAIGLTNQLAVEVPDAAFSMVIPAALNVSANPLLAPVPSGASYDAGTRTISFLGPIAPGATVTIRFAGTMSAAGQCQVNMSGTAGFGATCRNSQVGLFLLIVPPVPTQAYLVGVYSFRGVFMFEPGADTALRDLLCLGGEIYAGMGRGPDGSIVVTGLPNFVFNPETLDLFFFDAALEAAGWHLPHDAAIDPMDGTLIITGVGSGSGVGRLDPVTGATTLIVQESGFGGTGSVVVDPDGSIVFLTGSMGMRRIVDARTGPFPLPAGSTVPITLPVPVYADVPMGNPFGTMVTSRMVPTPSGDYSVLATTAFLNGNVYTAANALIDVERATGAATLINRAITAQSFSLQTGLPLLLPPALGALAFSEANSDAMARSSDRFFALPTGSGNTTLTIIDTASMPQAVVGSFPHAAFAAHDAEFVAGPPACAADFNHDGVVNSQDFFDFLGAFFVSDASADFNHDGVVNSQDFFDFLVVFFTPC